MLRVLLAAFVWMAVRAPAGLKATSDGGDDYDFGIREQARELRATRRRVRTESARPLLEWAQLLPLPSGGRLDVSEGGPWAFQREPFYSEEAARARESVTMKSTQVGASEGEVRATMREADQFGSTAIYVFPTDVHVREFGDERIEPIIEGSEYLQRRIPRHYVRSKGLKRIGGGWLHLRGANSISAAQSVGAQVLVLDEYDELPPKMIAQYERRLSGAKQQGKMPKLRRLGRPTLPGFGIAKEYGLSDRREWNVTCPKCGHEQPIRWAENVRWTMPGGDTVYRPGHDGDYENPKTVGDVWRACVQCEASLEGEPLMTGRWVKTNPDSDVPGWHVHRLIVPNTDLQEIVRSSRKTAEGEVEAFYNADLGLPYSSAESSLSDADIAAACTYGLAPDEAELRTGRYPRSMGVDVAGERDLTYRISDQLPSEQPDVPNPRQAVKIGMANSFERVEELIVEFGVEMVAVDANPERRAARALQRKFPGRVVLVEYETNPAAPSFKISEVGPPGTPLEGIPLVVRVHRTEAIDSMMDAIRQVRNRPLQVPPPGYVEQLKAPKRKTELDSKKRPVRVYVSTGPDDYAHTEVYDLVATEMLRLKHGVGMQAAAAKPRTMKDQDIGYRRVQLEQGHHDDYRPGFGGE